MRFKESRVASWTILIVLVVFVNGVQAASVANGGFGLPHVRAAWVLDKGHLTANAYTRFWGRTAPQSYAPFGTPGDRAVWDLHTAFMLNLGVGAQIELELSPVLYQSDQSEKGQSLHDIQAGATVALPSWPTPAVQWGARFTFTIPQGKRHNLLFEEYSASAYAFSCAGLLSYAFDPVFPQEAPSLHFNAGYHLYNDIGEVLTGDYFDPNSQVIRRSQWLGYSLGLLLPGERFDWGAECYGMHWLQQPPKAAEGREDHLYGGLFLTYKPLHWLRFRLGGEIRLSEDSDETVPSLADRGLGEFPNYNDWRLQLGVQMNVLPLHLLRTTTRELFIRRADERRELFEQIIDDGSRSPATASELERIRAERTRAEKELERLQKILDRRKEAEKRAQQDTNNE